MQNDELAKLTIIVPTYCRPRYVLRQLEYWKDSGVTLVILDGSPTEMQVPAEYVCPSVRYVYSGSHFVDRLATVRKYVSTPYCAMLGDDEFYAFSGLRQAIRLMEADQSVIGCVGRCLYFFVDQGRFLVRDAYRQWKSFSKFANTAHQRLHEDLPPNKTHMAHYSVMRSPIWIQIMENAYQRRFSSAFVYERLVNLQRAMLGRTEVLECLFWFRSMENRNISNQQVGAPPFLDWALDESYQVEVVEYRKIARQLLVDGGIPESDAAEFERRFFEDGVELTRIRKSRLIYRAKKRVRLFLLALGPRSLRLFAKRRVPNLFLTPSGWQGFGIDEMCESLYLRGTSFERSEIDRVRDLAISTAQEELILRESSVGL